MQRKFEDVQQREARASGHMKDFSSQSSVSVAVDAGVCLKLDRLSLRKAMKKMQNKRER